MRPRTLHDAARAEARQAGFTLLELLVGLALMALLMAAVPPALRIAARALDQSQALTNEAADQAALDFLGERLGQTMSLFERGEDGRLRIVFSGEPNRISFVAPGAMDPNADPPAGLFLLELRLTQTDTRQQLMLRWQPFRTGQAAGGGAGAVSELVLLDSVAGLSFRYLGAPAKGPAVWTDVWTSADTLPEVVEVVIPRRRQSAGGPWMLRVPLRLRLNR
jgi:general secretion pathway protein J